ncbi:MAG: TonB family protein [Panacagrimonas sp.]
MKGFRLGQTLAVPPTRRARTGAALCTLGLHLLLVWCLFADATPQRAAQPPAEGRSTQVRLLAIPATALSLPAPVEAPALRTPRLELPPPRLNIAAPTSDTAPPSAQPSVSASAAAAAPAAPGQAASRAPNIVASVDCLPLRWLQGVSRRISFELNYPSQERRLNHRGTAYVRVSVNRSGVVIDAPLLRGSGYAALDLEAQAVFRRIGRFAPVPAEACKGADIMVIDQPIGFGVAPF